MSYSQITVIGRLVDAPDIRTYGAENKELANFRIAANLGRDKTEFYSCTAWGKTAEIVKKYTNKGSQVQVVGVMESSRYTKDVAGTPVEMTSWKINVNQVTLLGSKSDNQQNVQPTVTQSAQPRQQIQTQTFTGFNVDDDLPF